MKIRTDYVSNSSSSSFVICGTKLEPKAVTPDLFDSLDPDEGLYIVVKTRWADGDYIFNLTPELLMDCDMHQIDLGSPAITLYRVKCVILSGGTIVPGNWIVKDPYEWGGDVPAEYEQKISAFGLALRSGKGVKRNQPMKLFSFWQDNGVPVERGQIIDAIERATMQDACDAEWDGE